MLQFQQPDFLMDAPGVSGQTAVGSYYPVAGDENGDLIVSHSAAHCLGGHAGYSLLPCKLLSDFAIGHGLPIGNLQKNAPNSLPEGGTNGMQGRHEIGFFAGEVNIQLAFGFRKDWCFLPDMFLGQIVGKIFFALKPQTGQSCFVCRQQNVAQW